MKKDYGDYNPIVKTLDEAYRAFAHHYALRNPPPEKPVEKRQIIPMPGLKFSMFAVMIGSQIVSAFHSVPEIAAGITTVANEELKYLLVLSIFLMLETAIIVYSYFRTKRQFEATGQEADGLDMRIKIGLGLSLFILIAANLNSALKANHVEGLEIITSLINVTIGLCAPILALVSGDVLAILRVTDAKVIDEATRKYEMKLSKWRKGMNKTWSLEKKQWGAKVSVVRPEFQQPSNGNSIGNPMENNQPLLPSASTLGHSKAPDASKKVKDYLDGLEDTSNLNALEIARHLNVGKSTVYNVLNDYKKPLTNGKDTGNVVQ